MIATTHWFVIATILAAALASIAIWSPRALPLKITSLVCATALLPLCYFSLNDILSRPKPVQLESVHKEVSQVNVLSSVMKEGEATYVWLQIPEIDEPRSYKLPWSDNTAKQLHKAQQEAEQTGTEVKMKKPFEKTVDSQEPVFYAAPPAAPAEKQAVDQDPILFQATAQED